MKDPFSAMRKAMQKPKGGQKPMRMVGPPKLKLAAGPAKSLREKAAEAED